MKRNICLSITVLAGCLCLSLPMQASAGYIISSAILEFTNDGPRHQDIEIISQSEKNDYVVAEVAEILHPGEANEIRHVIDDFSESGLLVTPDKMVLAGRSRKIMRFIALKDFDAQEHIYRVAIKPVIKNATANDKLGLKILIGYEVLVIIRPLAVAPSFTASRRGDVLSIADTGNTDILFQNGQQCSAKNACSKLPVIRIYPGQNMRVSLPFDLPSSYSIWDGKDTTYRQF